MLLSVATILLILGPDGGKNGGMVIATGTPEQVAKIEKELYWSIFEENT